MIVLQSAVSEATFKVLCNAQMVHDKNAAKCRWC